MDCSYEKTEFVFLLLRIITGEPTASAKPTTTQKWSRNKQAGGGAVQPCSWLLHVQKGEGNFKKVTKIINTIRSMGFSIDGFQNMEIRVNKKFSLIHEAMEGYNNSWLTMFIYFTQIPESSLETKFRSSCWGLINISANLPVCMGLDILFIYFLSFSYVINLS